MASSGKSTCCLMLIFLLIQQTVSFSVEELCARRCLYGRGGVLCNCNAMHFTGKRSNSPHFFGTNKNTMDSNDLDSFSHVSDSEEENSNILSSMYGTVGTSDNHAYHHKFGDGTNDVLGNSWNQRQMENVLASLDPSADPDVLDSKQEALHKSRGSLPLLLLANNIQEDDNEEEDIAGRTRAEVASRVKMIMGGAPFVATAEHVAQDDGDPHDLMSNKQGRIAASSDKSREHLSRLHRVLDQALQGR